MMLNHPPSQVLTSTSPYPQERVWLESHWMPYTANRSFKESPRMMVSCLLYTSDAADE